MTNQEINKLEWKIYKWMINEILKILISKDLISEKYSPAFGKYYEANLIQEGK